MDRNRSLWFICWQNKFEISNKVLSMFAHSCRWTLHGGQNPSRPVSHSPFKACFPKIYTQSNFWQARVKQTWVDKGGWMNRRGTRSRVPWAKIGQLELYNGNNLQPPHLPLGSALKQLWLYNVLLTWPLIEISRGRDIRIRFIAAEQRMRRSALPLAILVSTSALAGELYDLMTRNWYW